MFCVIDGHMDVAVFMAICIQCMTVWGSGRQAPHCNETSMYCVMDMLLGELEVELSIGCWFSFNVRSD